jgi:3-oxoacyl-[acyl-carrier protein] reductase
VVWQLNAKQFPMQRNLNISDIIPTIEFLLSDGASMITGMNIGITGGRRG